MNTYEVFIPLYLIRRDAIKHGIRSIGYVTVRPFISVKGIKGSARKFHGRHAYGDIVDSEHFSGSALHFVMYHASARETDIRGGRLVGDTVL